MMKNKFFYGHQQPPPVVKRKSPPLQPVPRQLGEQLQSEEARRQAIIMDYCEKIIKFIKDKSSTDDQCLKYIFKSVDEKITNSFLSRIQSLKKAFNEDNTININDFVNQIIKTQLIQLFSIKDSDPKLLDVRQFESEEHKKNSEQDQTKIDEKLNILAKKLKEEHKDKISTSENDFVKIKVEYKEFFKKRCEEIMIKSKNEKKNVFKDDPELREFMIRHNRFVPLFNLRYVSVDLLEQMANRFKRMKKDPDDIEREYDKIELISSK